MRTFREILMLMRLANAELAVRSCQMKIEAERAALEKAITARDQAKADLNVLDFESVAEGNYEFLRKKT